MPAIQLTPEERIQGLQRFGYSEREASFLAIAALHGGYFLRRQFARFLAREDGGAVVQLIDKALALGHVQVFTYEHKVHIHHLGARSLYRALGEEDNRNRRQRQPLTIKNKLMGLDFVLKTPEGQYLATEKEKLDHFCRGLQLPESVLPVKLYRGADGESTARYFVDKYPLFLLPASAPAASPVVSFCYVDEGMTTLSRFDSFIAQYGRLFACLPEFRVIYVASTPVLFSGARKCFERFVAKQGNGMDGSAMDPDIRHMLEHFEARRLYEMKQLTGFDRAKLIRFRNEREAYSGPQHMSLYELWKGGGNQAVLQILKTEMRLPARWQAAFSTCLLEHRYDIFGTLTAY